MKKFVVGLVLILLVSLSLTAKPELWLGANFLADRNMISSDLKENFPAFGNGDFKHIKALGPGFEVSFFPFSQFRLGLYGSSHTVFPIGYMNSNDNTIGYIMRHFEFRQDLTAGIAFNQLFGSWGIFATCTFDYSWYRTVKENSANNKHPDFNPIFSEYGITADLGLLAVYGKGYFKFGFSYSNMLSNDGNRIVLFCGGGTRI